MSETTPSQRTPSECANDASTRVTEGSKPTVKPHPLFDPGPPVVVYNGSKKRKNLMTMKELAEFSKLDRSELYYDRLTNPKSKGE